MDLTTLFNTAETALTTYSNTSTAVSTDQQKIAALQTQLAADQTKQLSDGQAAYQAVGDVIAALQAVQAGLPAPAIAPATPAAA